MSIYAVNVFFAFCCIFLQFHSNLLHKHSFVNKTPLSEGRRPLRSHTLFAVMSGKRVGRCFGAAAIRDLLRIATIASRFPQKTAAFAKEKAAVSHTVMALFWFFTSGATQFPAAKAGARDRRYRKNILACICRALPSKGKATARKLTSNIAFLHHRSPK